MLMQFGLQSQIHNILTLIGTKSLHDVKSISTLEEVRSEYRDFIFRVQHRTAGGKCGRVNFVTDVEEANRLRPLFINDSTLDDKRQAQVIDAHIDPLASQKADLIARALHELSLYSDAHRVLFETIITDVFILPSTIAKAGSTSQAIGVIWASPKLDYTVHDVIEILVHEMTHHSMFIDELRHRHYVYENISRKSTWAKSAILGTLRPLDKVLHSAVVSMEILLLRDQLLGHPVNPRVHPTTDVLTKQLTDAIASLERVLATSDAPDSLLEPRAMDIVAMLRQKSEKFEDRSTNRRTHLRQPPSLAQDAPDVAHQN